MRFPHATRRSASSPCLLLAGICGMRHVAFVAQLQFALSLTIPRSLSLSLQLFHSSTLCLSLCLYLPLPLCFSQAIKSCRTALIVTISRLNEQKANDRSPIPARSRRDLDAIFSRSSLSWASSSCCCSTLQVFSFNLLLC